MNGKLVMALVIVALLVAGLAVSFLGAKSVNAEIAGDSSIAISCSSAICNGRCSGSCNIGKGCDCGITCAANMGRACSCGK